MKNLFLILCILVASISFVLAQEEIAFVNRDDLKARLDALFIQLANEPSAKGYIVICPPSPSRFNYVKQVINDYINFRKFDPARIVLIAGEKRDVRPILTLWVVPAGAEFRLDQSGNPEPKPRYTVGANPSACELNGMYLQELGRELANNPSFSLEIRYYNGKNESEAVSRKRIELLKKTLKKQFFAPIKFISYGNAEGNAETQFFLKTFEGNEEYFLKVYAIKNKSICLACCDSADLPKNLAPVKNKKLKK